MYKTITITERLRGTSTTVRVNTKNLTTFGYDPAYEISVRTYNRIIKDLQGTCFGIMDESPKLLDYAEDNRDKRHIYIMMD